MVGLVVLFVAGIGVVGRHVPKRSKGEVGVVPFDVVQGGISIWDTVGEDRSRMIIAALLRVIIGPA